MYPEQILQEKHRKRWALKNRIEEKINQRNNLPYIPDLNRRKELDSGAKAETPGERTYGWFRWMHSLWIKAPKFDTAFDIQLQVHRLELTAEDQAAKELAWSEFQRRYLWPHEQEAMLKNGDI